MPAPIVDLHQGGTNLPMPMLLNVIKASAEHHIMRRRQALLQFLDMSRSISQHIKKGLLLVPRLFGAIRLRFTENLPPWNETSTH